MRIPKGRRLHPIATVGPLSPAEEEEPSPELLRRRKRCAEREAEEAGGEDGGQSAGDA